METKTNLLIGFLLFIGWACSDQQEIQHCDKLHSGEFEYKYRVSGDEVHLINVKRNDSIQVETDERTGWIMKLRIDWEGECRYNLRILSLSINGEDPVLDQTKQLVVTSQIKKIAKNYYICETSNSSNFNARTDTIEILKLPRESKQTKN